MSVGGVIRGYYGRVNYSVPVVGFPFLSSHALFHAIRHLPVVSMVDPTMSGDLIRRSL